MRLTISPSNPKLAIDEFGNPFMEFKGDYYADFLKFIEYYRYKRF